MKEWYYYFSLNSKNTFGSGDSTNTNCQLLNAKKLLEMIFKFH